jgi:hypothetical protein
VGEVTDIYLGKKTPAFLHGATGMESAREDACFSIIAGFRTLDLQVGIALTHAANHPILASPVG